MNTQRFTGFPEALFEFLGELSMNNNRQWFDENKSRYQQSVVAPVSHFIEVMGERLGNISDEFIADSRSNGGSMFRIHRDTRFAKDKRPFKENVGCQFRHVAGKSAHALAFYVHLQPGNVFAGAGLWTPPSPALSKIRTAIVDHPELWKDATNNKKLVKRFGEIAGERLKRPPKGYAADHPFVEDLKRKSFFLKHSMDPSLALTPRFIGEVVKVYADATPLMRFLATALKLPY